MMYPSSGVSAKWNQSGSFEFSFGIQEISIYQRQAKSKFILKLVMWEKDYLLRTPDKKWVHRYKLNKELLVFFFTT